MCLRKNAGWMRQADDRVLEYLDREGWGDPELIITCPSINATEGIIRDHLRLLQYAGLVAPLWSDAYELTTWGAPCLRGGLDAGHRPRPTPERVRRGIRLDNGHSGSAKIDA